MSPHSDFNKSSSVTEQIKIKCNGEKCLVQGQTAHRL